MNEQLIKYVETLKQVGFTVFTSTKDYNYIIFSKNKHVGYCQFDGYFSFSSRHKPNRRTGTGFSVHRDVDTPTVQHAADTFVRGPHWASSADLQSVVKWKDINEYIAKHTPLTYRQM